MAPIFSNDYNTIKSPPPIKERDDVISFGNNTKTNGYSIVRSAMVAVFIAIVAVTGVVTLRQSSPMMSTTMAVASEDFPLATLSEEETQMTAIDTSLAAEEEGSYPAARVLNSTPYPMTGVITYVWGTVGIPNRRHRFTNVAAGHQAGPFRRGLALITRVEATVNGVECRRFNPSRGTSRSRYVVIWLGNNRCEVVQRTF